MSLERQAVRVAAAAAALVEDAQAVTAPRPATAAAGIRARRWWKPSEMVLDMVRDERARHPAQWGGEPLSPVQWLMILTAELGALAQATLAPGKEPAEDSLDRTLHLLREAASAAEAWLAAQAPPAGTP